ncbi:hypothetical protein SOVF_102270 [Spinacia oleracea]|uniref:Uncharacterized protein n=1 Tax=Spinacia oleracea TaxID=3562 RepID=A0A9R0JL93_SPIOL|nr:uncharacterized protein LOC110778652 [Spinacia oleracea]KNA15000.1 hypothetical protein SOVF_102270 [Spinacia oleracea]
MEIPVINFEAGINSFHNPSLIYRVISNFELGKLTYYSNRMWKWGALFLALVYAFSSIVNKIKLLVLYYHNKSKSLLAASEPLLSSLYDEFGSDTDSDYDQNDEVCSSCDSSSDDDDDEDDEIEIEDDDFNVKGSSNFSEISRRKGKFKLMRRKRSFVDTFSLSDLVNGNGVVKLWDGLGLGVVDVDNAFSFLDSDHYQNQDFISSSIFGGIPAVSTSPAVFISAGSDGGKLGLDIWDLRTGGESPVVRSHWRSGRRGEIMGMDSGRTGKVYVRNDDTMTLAVGDVRKVDAPLTEECEEEMWWDADE